MRQGKRKYQIGELKFNNLKELADSAGISYAAAVKRSHRGWADEEIYYGRNKNYEPSLKLKVKKPRGKEVTVGGAVFENTRHAYDALTPTASFNTVLARLRYGWSREEAFEVNKKIDGRKVRKQVRFLKIANETINAKQAAEKFNIPYSTVLDRLCRGATDEQALGLSPINEGDLLKQRQVYKNRRTINRQTYLVEGVVYKSVRELAEAYNLSPKLVYNRMRDNGWTPEKSVKEPVSDNVIVNGEVYRSAMRAWEKIGETNFRIYTSRKSAGHLLEVCLGLQPLPAQERYEVDGKAFKNLSEVSEAYGLSVSQLNYRLKLMPLEEAINYVPSNGKYSEGKFRDDPLLSESKGCFYFITIHLSEGSLHKVGITKKDVSKRFSGFEYEVLAMYTGRLFDIFQIEQATLAEFRDYHYRAEEEFEGKTETFLLMSDEEELMAEFIERMAQQYNCMPLLENV